MATIHSINLIASDPEVRGGRPCIAGTGIRVLDIVAVSCSTTRHPPRLLKPTRSHWPRCTLPWRTTTSTKPR